VVEAHHPNRPSDDRRPGIPELPMPPSCSAAGASLSLPQPPMRAIFCPSAAAIAIREGKWPQSTRIVQRKRRYPVPPLH
jgi:hypothetical protein